jgi:hypothetical protein
MRRNRFCLGFPFIPKPLEILDSQTFCRKRALLRLRQQKTGFPMYSGIFRCSVFRRQAFRPEVSAAAIRPFAARAKFNRPAEIVFFQSL